MAIEIIAFDDLFITFDKLYIWCFDNNSDTYNKKPTFTDYVGTMLSVSLGFILETIMGIIRRLE